MATWQTITSRRIFTLDVEARPGPWGGGDFTFKSMLSIAGVYEDDPDHPIYLGPGFRPNALTKFAKHLQGNLVVTHNGPRYDLPLLNGTLIKMGCDPLRGALISDTYAHLPRRGLAFSASLGNMAQRFAVDHQKGHMSEVDWERAYAGDAEALETLRDYNIGDCHTTLALRRRLMELGILGPPRPWRP
jgi:hypothetical protein